MLRSSCTILFYILNFLFINSLPSFAVIIADIEIGWVPKAKKSKTKKGTSSGMGIPTVKGNAPSTTTKVSPLRGRPPKSPVPLAEDQPVPEIAPLNYIRIFFFDTETQKFISRNGSDPCEIYHFSYPSRTAVIVSQTSDFNPAPGEQPKISSFEFSEWFNIKYIKQADKEDVVIDLAPFKDNAKNKIIRCKNDSLLYTPLSTTNSGFKILPFHDFTQVNYSYFSLSQNNFPIEKPLDDIKTTFNQYSDRGIDKNNIIKINKYSLDTERNIIPNEFVLDKETTGNLGELCATITMLSLGFKVYNGKYSATQGFDGVFYKSSTPLDENFTPSDDSLLFISESKARLSSTTRTPSNDELFRNLVCDFKNRLQLLETMEDQPQKKTGQLIKTFLASTYIDKIYLLPYTILSTGNARTHVAQYFPTLQNMTSLTILHPSQILPQIDKETISHKKKVEDILASLACLKENDLIYTAQKILAGKNISLIRNPL